MSKDPFAELAVELNADAKAKRKRTSAAAAKTLADIDGPVSPSKESQAPSASGKPKENAEMAKKTNDPVAAGEPDYAAAAAIIRTEIRGDKEELSKIQGDLSASWKRVEGCGVNKKAAKEALKMLGMSEEALDDYLRSLWNMMAAFNLGISEDLVDAMEGNGSGLSMPTRKADAQSALLN